MVVGASVVVDAFVVVGAFVVAGASGVVRAPAVDATELGVLVRASLLQDAASTVRAVIIVSLAVARIGHVGMGRRARARCVLLPPGIARGAAIVLEPQS